MNDEVIYIPGTPATHPEPLARYLPPLPRGIAPAWLVNRFSPGDWLLDPFGTSPRLAVEIAQAGCRILVVSHNPIIRFLLDLWSNPLSQSSLQSALADLATTPRGDQRLEPYIQSLYNTECAACGAIIPAEAFIWERSAAYPVQRIYHCSKCDDSGERPVTQADIDRAIQFSGTGLHRARALERVAAIDDPDRVHVEEALSTYVPRAIYVLLTLINKLDNLPATHQRALRALLLLTFDLSNTLWHYPTIRFRPRQLSTPLHFIEKNIWIALEESVAPFTNLYYDQPLPVPYTIWPDLPPPDGGVCVFDGRLKELAESDSSLQFQGVFTALPRPNQAFWTYSALWSGWLWGPTVAAPFKIGLRRRRYDWSWHTNALHAAFTNCKSLLASRAQILGVIGELESGYLSSVILGSVMAGYRLDGIALRPDGGQAQIQWLSEETHESGGGASLDTLLSKAIEEYLLERGEPADYIYLHAAGLLALAKFGQHLSILRATTTDAFGQLQEAFKEIFTRESDMIHFDGSEHSLEVGQWWQMSERLQKNLGQLAVSLADRVEMECVRYLLKQPGCTLADVDQAMCRSFPGLFTPNSQLIKTCLESYGEQNPLEMDEHWYLRKQDDPKIRRLELIEIHDIIHKLGENIGYSVKDLTPHHIIWIEPDIHFYVIASAVISKIILGTLHPPNKNIIVLPASRAPLIGVKYRQNYFLKQQVDSGWRFLKYRHLRRLYESQLLTQDNLDEQLAVDTITNLTSQMPLL